MRRNPIILSVLFLYVFVAVMGTKHVQAEEGRIILRDTETEAILKSWSTPIFRQAGLDPDQVNIVLVQDPQINAFVAGGQNIFLYTGLIQRTETAEELLGVIAHETGHIAGGHLTGLRQAYGKASYETMIGAVLGIGAALASGSGKVGSAIALGTQEVAKSRFLSHSRLQESSADQAAVTYLGNANINTAGLVSFFEKLQDEELVPTEDQAEYIRTHPLTANRIESVMTRAKAASSYQAQSASTYNPAYQRLKAKLTAYLQPDRVDWMTFYSKEDELYARAIAAMRNNQLDKAENFSKKLLALSNHDPYVYELLGDIAAKRNDGDAAVAAYKKTLAAVPKAGLVRLSMAQALIAKHYSSDASEEAGMAEAVAQLKKALETEKRSARLHRLMATAYGRMGEKTYANVHLAEEAVLQGRYEEAKRLAGYVMDNEKEGSRLWYQASDIENLAQQNLDKAEN